MTLMERKAFQDAGGTLLLSKWQKLSMIFLGLLVVFGISKCNDTEQGQEKSMSGSGEVGVALKQLEEAMKDPRKVRLLECEGINPWEVKPAGWFPPTKEECSEIAEVLDAESEARRRNPK